MKVLTVLGTRPEIIRLSLIIKKLYQYCHHVLVHTGQNYEESLSSIFFKDLGLREPDHFLEIRGNTFGEQVGRLFIAAETVIMKEKPDRILILGDTNSGLVSVLAKRMGIPVFHLEAGNRCFDYRVPEEVNRKIIDHSSTILLPYTYRSKENLINEGISNEVIYVVGNPIFEVLEHYSEKIKGSEILEKLRLQLKRYFLVTMHRAENVDERNRLKSILVGLDRISKKYGYPVICSLHPRTKNKIEQFHLIPGEYIHLSEPFGFFDFIALEKNALCVITDSGTVQEECSIFKVPNITIRDVTERPETVECGSNIISGVSPDMMLKAVEIVLDEKPEWNPPSDYLEKNVSSKVVKIILGYLNI